MISISNNFLASGSRVNNRFQSGGIEAGKSRFWDLARRYSQPPLIYLMAALRICAALGKINMSESEKEKLS